MHRRSPTTDDGGESSLETDNKVDKPGDHLESLNNGQPPSNDLTSTSLNWRQANGHNELPSHAVARTALSPSSFPNPPSNMVATNKLASTNPRYKRGVWSTSRLSFLTATVGVILLCLILRSLITHQIEPKGCQMSYMRPSYIRFIEFDTEHTRFATKYSLYLYREQGIDEESRLNGIPILFIPGNAGSYKQVRPIAAEAANYFHDHLQHDAMSIESGVRNLDFFTVDFNEDITAFHGQTLLDQAEYLNEAVRYILSLYSEPQRASRDSHLPDPSSVLVLGHSMGGVVARAMLIQSNYQANSINTIITMSAPHARPPVTFDSQIVQIYDEINDYWRRAYTQQWASNNPLWHVTLVSIAGGSLDTVVPSDYASIESLVPETHGFTVFTTGIPTVWTSMDHQAILWCDQFRKVVSQTLFDIVDVHRASQTKPRADRMRIFKKRFLTGMEAIVEKTLSLSEPTTLLTLDDESSTIVSSGRRLVVPNLSLSVKSKVHLLPIPPRGSPDPKRFTFLTDAQVEKTDENGQLQVLLCSVFPSQSTTHPTFTSNINLSGNNSATTRLACKNAASDVVLLPASTLESSHPFHLQQEHVMQPFSYLQYDLEYLSEHQFVAVVDRARTQKPGFVFAEFSDQSDFQQRHDITLPELLTTGLSFQLPARRPFAVEVDVPSLKSGLITYRLELAAQRCLETSLFAPLVRQYLEKPYESKFFVNVNQVDISFHGAAPYVPPPLEAGGHAGVAFGIWSDPTCEGSVDIALRVDMLGSLGKLYMRYRTVFAAFPLLIVTLILRKQFSVYDETGDFISFPESLELSLRRSIPLLLLSLTALTVSLSGVATFWSSRWASVAKMTTPSSGVDFHHNDLLTGTEDPFFMILVPLLGVVCIGVCAVLHYLTLGLTQVLGIFYGLITRTPAAYFENVQVRETSPTFVPYSPRRRMISTAILLFLVSTFIPYQFAYLVACLVQLFTVVRALRVYSTITTATHSNLGSNSNYYHYSHSILLLMMWVLPINLPILAVWIRNLAVHWLTPFSSHHNVLSIMPFILLVENLTTGRMVPQIESRLRYVTSGLLFGTAFCAAIYGVSHAYILHYLVNVVAAWLVVLHSTSESWSLTSLGAMFEGSADEPGNREKSP